MKKYVLVTALIFNTLILFSQKYDCNVKNNAFKAGEKITFEISYNWVGIPWAKVGFATFSVLESKYNNKDCYYLFGIGKTYSSWNWFYKMSVVHKSWVDKKTLKQLHFERESKEPEFFIDQQYTFNWEDNLAYSKYKSTKHSLRYDTIKITPCTFDLMSILYYARNIDYSKYKPGDKINISIVLDRKLTNIYYRYLGKEKVRISKMGKFDCIKLGIYLVEGTMFHEGENMELWVTDDENKIPVYVKSPILIGSVKAKLINYEGLRNPLDAKR